MILKEGQTTNNVTASFDRLDSGKEDLLEAYRDATYSEPDFRLQLIYFWSGLAKGMEQGWVRATPSMARLWGKINIDEYKYFDDPYNGDLQEVVPGKFIAFKGPVDFGPFVYRDSASGARTFAPSYYANILHEM